MARLPQLEVAVLLATFNGAKHVAEQIKSLSDNSTPFTLHWLDDHSSDETRDVVRRTAAAYHISLVEQHQSTHVGVPASFFRLLEQAEADIYLFCDQDDIWLPGKIDATVTSLAHRTSSPALCFSDTQLFGGAYLRPRSLFNIIGSSRSARALRRPEMLEMFSCAVAPGHTQGFTQPVRELFLRYRSIAYEYAFMHDWWIHDLTIAAGTIHLFSMTPTVLWRQHDDSFCGAGTAAANSSLPSRWRQVQRWRRICAKHARGFSLTSTAFPPGPRSDRFTALAQAISVIDQRQSLRSILRILKFRAFPVILRDAALFLLACLLSDANPVSKE